MKGNVLPKGRCECGEKFVFYRRGKKEDYRCPVCKKPPERYVVTAKFAKCGRLYSTPDGEVFNSYAKAMKTLFDINSAYEDSRKPNGRKFNPKDYIPAQAQQNKFESLVNRWLKNYDAELENNAKSKSRVNGLYNICNSFLIPHFTGKDIRDITREDIEILYHSLLDKSYSTRYIKDVLDTLKSIFIYTEVKPPKFPEFTVVPKIEKQRLGIARELLVMPCIPEKYRLCILVLIRTGMRIGEVIAFKVSDIEDGTIYVDKRISEGRLMLSRKPGRGKPGKLTLYQVTPEIWRDLIAYVSDKAPDDIIFPFTRGRLYKVWKKACEDAKVKHISLQQASRHSKASEIYRRHREMALQEIQDTLGHDNKQTGIKHYVVDE